MLWRTHVWFEIMDMYDDAKTDKRTIAVKVGHSWACVIVLAFTLTEAAVVRVNIMVRYISSSSI